MVKLHTKEKFTEQIYKYIVEKNVTVMDAILLYIEEHNVEIEVASKLLDKSLKEKLESEVIELNLLKKKESLPI